MATDTTKDLCNICIDDTPINTTLKSCARCHGGAKYCGEKCQKRDWPIHKIFCNLKQTTGVASDDSSIQALFFPHDSKEPVWVRVKVAGRPDFSQYVPGTLGENVRYYNNILFPQYENPGYEMDGGYSFYFQTKSLLPENECMKRVLLGSAKSKFGSGEIAGLGLGDIWRSHFERQQRWRGPLLVIKTNLGDNGGTTSMYTDLGMRDIKYLVLYLDWISTMVGTHGIGGTDAMQY